MALVAAGAAMPTVVAPSAQAATRQFGDRILKSGTKGQDVRVLQDFLSRAGVGTPVDGRFGPATRTKVRAWERRRVQAAGAAAGARSAGVVRVDGRLTRREARLLRADVEAAEQGRTPAGAEPAPDAPPPAAGEKAVIGSDGKAIAPASAPEQVKRIIAAANEIHDKPYRYGGGHKPPPNKDTGYDCSGSMSYAFQGADMMEDPLTSTGFESFGDAGPGQWVTTYANSGHSYMVVAGLRFDTSGRKDAGSRWQKSERSASGYTVRHPKGL